MKQNDGNGFASWLARILAAEGRFTREQIGVWEKRALNRDQSFVEFLETSGVLTSEEIADYHNEFSAEKFDPDAPFVAKERKGDFFEPGSEVGGYKILALIGVGGMGVVYRALQISLQREVALKILKQDRLQDEEYRRRFVNEAVLASELSHRHIVRIYEANSFNGRLYFSMELVDGKNLQDQIDATGKLDPVSVKRIAMQICLALQHAMGKGIVHGDIKPANILMDSTGISKLADLGLAKRSFEDSKRLFGTYRYVSPEVILGRKADARSDIYSLGSTIYHLLTGIAPFEGLKKEKILDAHLAGSFPDPSLKVPDLPIEMVRLVRWMTALAPQDRPQSPQEILDFLGASQSSEVSAEKVKRRVSEMPVQRKSSSGLFVALIVIGLVIIGWFIYSATSKGNGKDNGATPQTTLTFVASTPTPAPSQAASTKYAGYAKRMYEPAKENFGRVLAYIEEKIPLATGDDADELRAFNEQILTERKAKVASLKDKLTKNVESLIAKSDFVAAYDAAGYFTVPQGWGLTAQDESLIGISKHLISLVDTALKAKIGEIDKLIAEGDFEKAAIELAKLNAKPIANFEHQILELTLRLEQEQAKHNAKLIAEAQPIYKESLQQLLAQVLEGDSEKINSKVLEIARNTALAPYKEDINHLKTDIKLVILFFDALTSFYEDKIKTGELISVGFTNGNRFTGKVAKISKKYYVEFKDKGLEGKMALTISTMIAEDIVKFASLGGFDTMKGQLAIAVLQAARGDWKQVWPIFEAVAPSSERTRWIERLAMFTAPQITDINTQKEAEDKAEAVYRSLLEAFQKDDLKKVAELAKKLLEEYKDSKTTQSHLKAIQELYAIATGKSIEVKPEEAIRDYDFANPLDRDAFFMRLFGGDIGNLGVDKKNKLYVTDGQDGLLLFKQTLTGKVAVEFEMTVETGSQIRVCMKTDRLGGGIVFAPDEFGPYDAVKTKYRRGGRKVKLEVVETGIKVTVDDKQEEIFAFIGKPNDALAIYFIGANARIWNLRLTGKFGPKAATVDSILKFYDAIYFADIRKKDLPKKDGK